VWTGWTNLTSIRSYETYSRGKSVHGDSQTSCKYRKKIEGRWTSERHRATLENTMLNTFFKVISIHRCSMSTLLFIRWTLSIFRSPGHLQVDTVKSYVNTSLS
jgi:hypothetical protein